MAYCGWPEDIKSRHRTWLDHGRRRVLRGIADGVDLILGSDSRSRLLYVWMWTMVGVAPVDR